jgi:hypothetical protein
MIPRPVRTVIAGCMVVGVTAFLAVYAAISALTDETWPDL